MRLTQLKVSFAFLAIYLVAGCSQPVEWNQKTTVEIEIDGETYTGSSVVRAQGRVNYDMSQGWAAGLLTRANGEAVIIDLGAHGLLFALLEYDPGRQAHRIVFADRFNRRARDPNRKRGTAGVIDDYRTIRADRNRYELTAERISPSPYVLKADQRPQFARFDDLMDPLSVQVVTPENLADIYGETARIRSVTFEITDEPQSPSQVSEVLPWIYDDNTIIPAPPGIWRERIDNPRPEYRLVQTQFVQEFIK